MRVFTTILFFSVLMVAQSQYRFDHLGINDGLSQSSVNDIFQDSEGFMWFATQDGLDRFDGYDFVSYNTESTPSLSGNFLWDILEDRNGNIWVASATGATRLNWRDEKSTKFYSNLREKRLSQSNQVGFIKDLGDEILISFDGRKSYAISYDLYSDSTEIQLDDSYAIDLIDHKSDKYIYSVFNYDESKVSIHNRHIRIGQDSIGLPADHLSTTFTHSVFKTSKGFFLGTTNGLLFVDIESKSIEEKCINARVNCIFASPNSQNLWIGTNSGLFIYDPVADQCIDRLLSGSDDDDLSSNLISSIYQSKDGLFWIGTANGGANIYDPLKDRFKFLNIKHGLSGQPIWGISHSDSILFLGAEDGLYFIDLNRKLTDGLFAMEAISSLKKITLPSFRGKRITSILPVSNSELYIGAGDGSLSFFDLKTSAIKSISLGNSLMITSIKLMNDELWVTTYGGIFKLSKDLKLIDHLHESHNQNMNASYFLSSYLSADSTLWFGSNAGFTTIDRFGEIVNFPFTENSPSSSPNHYFISGFYEDNNGLIWMSTFGGGVSVFDRTTQSFQHITTLDGLSNNTCSSIQGNDTHVFVGTNGGLSMIDIETKKVTSFTKKDGLLSSEFAMNSSSKLGDEFVFGVVDGVIVFKGSELTQNTSISKPEIASLEVNYSRAPFSFVDKGKLELNPSDKIFSLSFSHMSFRKRDQIEYEYRLDGFNADWVKVGASNRRATYSLDPGDYQFRVRSVCNGSKSDETTLGIIVYPAFYQTWWFIAISILLLILIVVMTVRYYSHQSLKEQLRKLEVQQKIQLERERISRDLHDNVGSQITYIASSIDNLSSNGEAEEIRELGEFTRDTMRQLRETIWVINHDEVSIEELKAKVIDYLAEILKHRPEITHKVNFSNIDISLNPTWAINVFRIIQEAVNNAVKHASPNQIMVEFICGKEVSIVIKDDGVGFDGDDKMGHFGLINMRSRVADIGGSFLIESERGKGTEISVKGLKIGQMT